MRLNMPKVAFWISRAGFRLSTVFRPKSQEYAAYRRLLEEAQHMNKLSQLTDKQIAQVTGEKIETGPDPYLQALLTEVVTRLDRSEGGPNP